ncbi:MAG TPA: GNAT family N-acetyltransferase [Dongiaceae bacterium]
MPTTAVELSSERLTLRVPRPGDAPAIAAQVNDWDVVRYTTSIPFPYDLGMAEAFIAAQIERWGEWDNRHIPIDEIAFIIERKADRQVLGCIGLQPPEAGAGVEFGYWIGRDHWKQGYASEAVGRLTAFAFETLAVEEIWAAAVPINDASHRVQDKNGFTIVGAGARESPARGGSLPVIIRKLTRAQWSKRYSITV